MPYMLHRLDSVYSHHHKMRFEKRHSQWKPPDGGYGWVIVFCGFMLQVLMMSVLSSFGVFFVEFVEYFNISKTTAAWMGACQTGSFAILGLVVGPICRKVGCRLVAIVSSFIFALGYITSAFTPSQSMLYLTFGVLPGLGWSGMHIASSVSVQHYFDKKRGLAGGIITTGIGVGVFFWPTLARVCIDAYGWRGALLIMGGIILNGAAVGGLLRPPIGPTLKTLVPDSPKHIDGDQSDEKSSMANDNSDKATTTTQQSIVSKWHDFHFKNILDWTLLKNPYFLIFCIATMLIQLGHLVAYSFTPARARELGIEKGRAAILVSLIGSTSTGGRALIGYMADKKFVDRTFLYGLTCTITGAASALSYTFQSFGVLVAYSLVFGIVGAAFMALMVTVMVDLLGVEHLTDATGIESAFLGFGMAASTPLSGYIADKTNDVGMPFLVLGLIQCFGGCMALMIAFFRHRREAKKKANAPEVGIEDPAAVTEGTEPTEPADVQVAIVDNKNSPNKISTSNNSLSKNSPSKISASNNSPSKISPSKKSKDGDEEETKALTADESVA